MNLRNLFIFILLASSATGCGPTIVAGVSHGSTKLSEDGRTFGSMIDDSSIVIEIDSLFSKVENISERSHINVTSINGVVLLTGETPDIETRNSILGIVRSVKGVKRTINEIRIDTPSSLGARSNDSWLTSKVKTKLVYDKRVDSTKIKVVSEDKSVFLLGLISRTEADYATATTRTVSGIKRVVVLFEYTD
ncbi:MAG: BON domain-containing protein [Acidiferrobacterales bacterium]